MRDCLIERAEDLIVAGGNQLIVQLRYVNCTRKRSGVLNWENGMPIRRDVGSEVELRRSLLPLSAPWQPFPRSRARASPIPQYPRIQDRKEGTTTRYLRRSSLSPPTETPTRSCGDNANSVVPHCANQRSGQCLQMPTMPHFRRRTHSTTSRRWNDEARA